MRFSAIALASVALFSSEAFAFVQHPRTASKAAIHSEAAFLPRPSYAKLLDPLFLATVVAEEEKTEVKSSKTELTKDEQEIRALFSLWNNALATGDSRLVTARYAKDAVLLPTVSDTPRTSPELIQDYFDAFLKRKPQGVITEGFIKIGDGFAKDSGIYEFTMGDNNTKVKARYTFVYVKENNKWKILHHHSSVMPEGIDIAQKITEEEVRGLFNLWNDALATLDSDAVASRYAKTSVLLPTVSDTPRTSYELIKDYFDNFLKRKPQGEILESYVQIGTNWAKDSGIYEFTMGDTGDKVKGRYSFIYVYEDGQWKISHHHSSVMPEGITIGQKIEKAEVRSLFNLWNDALATGDSSKVAARYSKNAVLLPTVSDKPRTSNELIVDYFNNFLKLEPQGVIDEGEIIVGTNWAQDAGIYTFTLGASGKKVQARYSFVYVYEDGEWKISHHHSSMMPEKVTVAEPITKEQVRDLFGLWNDALATKDPKKVTARYAKNAVLLPTVSDTPRTSPELIEDYFEAFLQKEPQGVIDSGDITIGANWAQDAGIYTFTMGNDGSKVQARYSFVYVFEDGEWKISHHHSSVMPEALLNPPKAEEKKEEVKEEKAEKVVKA